MRWKRSRCFPTIGFDNINWNAKAALSKLNNTRDYNLCPTILCRERGYRSGLKWFEDNNHFQFITRVFQMIMQSLMTTSRSSLDQDKNCPIWYSIKRFAQSTILNDSSKLIQTVSGTRKNYWISFAAYNESQKEDENCDLLFSEKSVYVKRLICWSLSLYAVVQCQI